MNLPQWPKTRQATSEEIVTRFKHYSRVSFDCYVREVYDPRAANGVRHIRRASARMQLVDGVPHVRHHGRLERLYARFTYLPNGSHVIFGATIVRQETGR